MTLFFMLSFALNAQFTEVGVFGGFSAYLGDLTPPGASVVNFNAAYGGFVRYNYNRFLSIKLKVVKSKLEGSDSNSDESEFRDRNLSFESDLTEFSLHQEFYPTGFDPQSRRTIAPFVGLGLSLFQFNPTTLFEGERVELQPLGTEGQGLKQYPDRQLYRLTQLALPLTLGLKVGLNERANVSIVFGYRFTFTDYIDDVSKTYVRDQDLLEGRGAVAVALANRSAEFTGIPVNRSGQRRGNANTNDAYYFAGLAFSINLYKKKSFQQPLKEMDFFHKWF